MLTNDQPNRVAVIGAGLVGALTAAMLSARGWNVDLFELRSDPRLTPPSARGRSINLALSPRGIEALRSVSEELANRVQTEGVAMRGRMVHSRPKSIGAATTQEGQDYGVYEEGEYIASISRSLLSIYLLDHLDTLGEESVEEKVKSGRGTVTTYFNHKMISMDMRKSQGVGMVFKVDQVDHEGKKVGEAKQVDFQVDFVIGGDGAYSKVRAEMMRGTRFNFAQSYARHAYLELSIPTGPNNTYSISPAHLHIWPRGEFMLIALPNQDKSFTLTLFAYDSTFESIAAKLSNLAPGGSNPIVDLFTAEFPDALELMGEERLLQEWRDNPKDGLITIECSPYHYEDKALLIGDAAHAMVPFYGQGMNCAFEDVRVLATILDHFQASPAPPPNYAASLPLPYSANNPALTTLASPGQSRLGQALAAYSVIRAPSLSAIQQLAASNYAEMASSVLSPLYLFRLSLDTFISKVFTKFGSKGVQGRGGQWESLYRMVTFRYGLAYEESLRRRAVQGKVLEVIGSTAIVGIGSIAVWGTMFGLRRVGGIEKVLSIARNAVGA